MPEPDRFTLNPDSGLPLYLQIAHELIYRIETGMLRANDKLPGIRKLAQELGVSFLTVDKAYKWLRSRGLVASIPGVGVKVVLTLDSNDEEVKQRGRIARTAQKVVDEAVRNHIDPVQLARSIMHRAHAHSKQHPRHRILFVECHPEYVDDYIAEMRQALSGLDVEIKGILTSALRKMVTSRNRADALPKSDYLMTTLYHFNFVQKNVARCGVKVVALSHTIDQEAIQRIVSLSSNSRLGVLLGPVDPAPAIIQTIEFYRDVAPGSVPFAVIDDSAAVRKLMAKSDVLIYTAACRKLLDQPWDRKPESILIRFVPDQEAINKMTMLLKHSEQQSPGGELTSR